MTLPNVPGIFVSRHNDRLLAGHFADREKMMQASASPEYAKHKSEHGKLVKQVLELQQKFQSVNAMLTMNLLSFLKKWLARHIQGEDKKYGVCFNGKGIY